ncbi:MAG: carboxypeptidase-like regulatory domain-containing protein [Bacteroidales bacterium]|nr:carboxypeptidase-like regulatory domain-containing protein [Bacteroidales bacterium]
MINQKPIVFALILIVFACNNIYSQSVRGFVYSTENAPLPYVNVYVKHTDIGTTTDAEGRYYIRLIEEGDYELIFSAIGYETRIIQVVVEDKEIVKNAFLKNSVVELEQVEVRAKRRDPAYEIIQNAIDFKKENSKQVNSYRCNVYIKAKENISDREKKRREKQKEQDEIEQMREEDDEIFPETDPALEQQKIKEQQQAQRTKLAYSMNMAEIDIELNYRYPNDIKEIRNGFEKHGYTENLFFLSTTEAKFDFYQNLINVENLNELPLVSPLNLSSVLTYKFKLEKTWFEDDKMIYHISVTPRKKGNASFEGFIDIIFGSYAIRRVDLSIEKGGLMFYDKFRIQQEYELFNDSIWLVTSQTFEYDTKETGREFSGLTSVKYRDYELNIDYPKRYFNNELAVTTQDAYERDTGYWESIRPEPLTEEEIEIIFIKDSIHGVYNSQEYLDSIDAEYNKVTWADIGLWGLGFMNREKKWHIWASSIPGLIDPFSVGGLRIGPYFGMFKEFENHKSFWASAHVNYGIRNNDFRGSIYLNYVYDPMKLSRISFNIGNGIGIVHQDMSFTGLIDRSNYVDSRYINFGHSSEIVNGLYLNLSASIKEHSSLEDYKFGTLVQDWVENNVPRSFDTYQLITSKIELTYVPFQKFMREPYKKVVLGSKWPSISIAYSKGIPSVFKSAVDFDYVEASIQQKIKISTFGTTTAKIGTGKFLNTESMFYENYKIFPRGDRWFFSSPMQNQLIDSTIYTTDWYFELHAVHHFNGALVNNIPLIKKLKLYTLTGFNYTWIKETNYHYLDYYAGIERTFRIQRQRFRIGVYFVYGGSNNSKAIPSVQFSINHYDRREKSWDY